VALLPNAGHGLLTPEVFSAFKFERIEMNDGTIVDTLDFKLLPCCECCIHSLG